MSTKRQATTNLNHDNWDREEEPEERGSFREAPEDELSKRVIKKARRQITGNTVGAADAAGGGASKSVFSGFAGFGKTSTNSSSSQGAAAPSPFSFLAKLPNAAASTSSSSTITNKPTFSFGGASTASTPTCVDVSKLDKKSTESSDKSTTYYAKLKGLNQAVSDWIKTHVDKNPLCILTPIFKDYEKYLKEIEEEEKHGTATAESSNASKPPDVAASTATSSTTFGNFKFSSAPTSIASTALTSTSEAKSTSTGNIFGNNSKLSSTDATKTNGFSFGLKTTDSKASAPSSSNTSSSTLAGFSFGKPISSSTDSTDEKKPAAMGFSFTPGATPFTFGNIQPPAAMPTSTSNADEDEEDQPPKVEFKQVVEDDAVFSKKCKVFVKKDGNFADRGVGTLYLKPVKDSEKTQLLVRADTNLGNILVNLILSEGIPAQRMGKNNVMLVCVPTPDVAKPTPMLLRVKTGEEADELLEAIEKYKK